MAGERLRLVSLSVQGGSLDGRSYEPDDVVGEVLIGSDPDCHLVLDLPSISPIHARVWTDLDASKVQDTHALRGLYVNTERVSGETPIGEGDLVWLGPPGDPESVCVRLRFEPWVETFPFAGVAAEPALEAAGGGVPGLEDPFVVGDAVVPETDPIAATAAAHGQPAVAEDSALPIPITMTDDAWAIDASPAAGTAPEPAAAEPVDDFFVADESAGGDAVIEAQPLAPGAHDLPPIELPPLVAPVPPERWTAAGPAAPLAAPPAPVAAHAPQAPPVPAAHASQAVPARAAKPSAAPVARAQPALATGGPPTVSGVPARAAAPPPVAAKSSRTPDPVPAVSARAGTAPPVVAPPRAQATPAVSEAPAQRSAATAARPAATSRRPASRVASARRSRGRMLPLAIGLVALAVVAALGLVWWRQSTGSVRLEVVTPARVRAGQHATLVGRGFAADSGKNAVLFDGQPAKVLSASPARIEVEVPSAASDSGGERQVSVVVRSGRHESAAVSITVLGGPRLHGLSPLAALPGDEVTLAGAGWGLGAVVRFAGVEAQVLEVEATRIRAIVPALPLGAGSQAPVVVTVGGVPSNAAPFVVGRLPLVTDVNPASASPGDVVRVSGLGFDADPLLDDVRVAGAPALVVAAGAERIEAVVPRVGPGDAARTLELRVAGSSDVGRVTLTVPPPAEASELRFVAEPFTAVAGRPHAVLATGIGPAFVLAAAGGRSAAARAVEAQGRLDAALAVLRTTAGITLEARGFDSSPVIGLAGRPEVLIEVAEEDAAAYNEDWSGLKGRGGPVTRARLARWWEALGRDLVLLGVRGERPHFAAALAPEGRALVQLFDAVKRSSGPGALQTAVSGAKPALRDALRLLALRVPASVTAPVVATAPPGAAGPAAAQAPPPPRLQLEGTYRGSELEGGDRRYVGVTFKQGGGSITYEGGISFSVPLTSVEPHGRDQVRFSVRMRGGMRYYAGKWDGERLTGSISTDDAGREVVASFELRR